MAEGGSTSGGSSGGSSSSYSGYAQAGASTLGTILDAVNNKESRVYNQHLQEIAMWQAERNRSDVLRQQDFTNTMSQKGYNLQERQVDENIAQGRDQMSMLKRKNIVDSLRRLTAANPSLVTGMKSLFAPTSGGQ